MSPQTPTVDEKVRQIEAICAERGVRMTRMRREVYRALLNSAAPRTAYELMEQLSDDLSRRLAPPTVYRALEFLLDQGLIHRLESNNAYLPCPEPGHEQDCVYFLCQQCGATQELVDERFGQLIFETANDMGFVPIKPVLEVQGRCRNCSEV